MSIGATLMLIASANMANSYRVGTLCFAHPTFAVINELGVTTMKRATPSELKDVAHCEVIGGIHAGKSGTVRDINTSKTGHVTITVEQKNGVRFKTLAKNVVVKQA